MINEDILDSKIKRLRIELPNYSFSHSSSEESSHNFVGRKQIFQKLERLIEATPDKTGVYLVTGSRGVGKTRLVNHVINQTSLQSDSNFSQNFKYVLTLLFSVAITQFCLQRFSIEIPLEIFMIIFLSFFLLLCYHNGDRYNIPKPPISPKPSKQKQIHQKVLNFIKELFFLINPYNPYKKKLYLLKINCNFILSAIKELFFLINPHNPYRRRLYLLKIILVVCGTQIISQITYFKISFTPTVIFFIYLGIVFIYMYCRKLCKYKKDDWNIQKSLELILYPILDPIKKYINSYNCLYLRINFGHKLKDEKDILRLIARTLSTEYHKYLNSLLQLFFWRAIAFAFLLLFAYLFSSIVEKQAFYNDLIKESSLYKASSQVHLNNSISLKNSISSKAKDSCNVETFLLALDELVFDISIRVKKLPQYLFCNSEKESICPIDYLFWMSFFLMYLFCVLLFRSSWIEHFFVTHQIIKRQLKRLNTDITYNTERENSINIKNEGIGIIGTRTKRMRGLADAREIEKELQDILNKVRQIPIFMCRPDFVIVFDELDKVEPDETNLKSEIQKTKASLFSIDTTRERQTEILKILSNMKYFLSTAEAKFIFIAGREMYDIYLADVSDRNNYIGSIFNAVIYVPSFLTDRSERTKADMTSLVEEFVCRRLIPHDYSKEPYNLTKYREYLEKEIYEVADDDEIRRQIHKIIASVEKKEIKQMRKETIVKRSQKMEQIQKIISEQNKEMEQQIQEVIIKQKQQMKSIQEIISKQNEKIEQPIREIIVEQNKEVERQIRKIIVEQNEKIKQIQKTIAVLQQFIIYLAHVSKGAPKKMMQLFESFIEVCEFYKRREDDSLIVQRYHSSRFFLTFNYYRQYTLGIIAYLITPIFNRLSESNIKEHSDKLLISSLRFVDFLFKFHKHPFSWKHLDISPEILEVNHAPELKSVAEDLLNYLTQVHINKSNFSFSDYRFDNLIANEIFTMTKTDEVFSALFSFSLDETLPLKKHYQDLLEKTQKEYNNNENPPRFINAISSLQVALGDLHYYDDELEEAGVCYKNAVQALRNLEQRKYEHEYDKEKKIGRIKDEDYETMTLEQLYLYVRNMLRLGMIYERRKQYDFAYMTYGELCKRVIRERNIEIEELRAGIVLRKDLDNNNKVAFVKAAKIGKVKKIEYLYNDNIEIPEYAGTIPSTIASPQPLYFKEISPNTNDMLFKKMTFEGLKMVYLPFIAKLQILEKSHMGGITRNHLEQLEKEFEFLTFVIDHKEAKLLEADFYSRVADILYYKNSDLKCKENENRKEEDDENGNNSGDNEKDTKNNSCTACYYYHKALSILLNLNVDKTKKTEREKNTVMKLLYASVEKINDNYSMKYCTILARILSDWGNVFFSCDNKSNEYEDGKYKCYICDAKDCNTQRRCHKCACYICDVNNCNTNNLGTILEKYINYINSESKKENRDVLLKAFSQGSNFSKMEIAFAMYTISLKAYTKANLYKRSAYQIFKMLHIFKYYEIYDYIDKLSSKVIYSLWHATEDLNVLELNKRKKDFGKDTIKEGIPLQNLLVDSDISRIRILIKELELKAVESNTKKLKEYYDLCITSPYGINYSITARIYQLRLKSMVNYEAYKKLMFEIRTDESEETLRKKQKDWDDDEKKLGIKFIVDNKTFNENAIEIFGEYFDFGKNDYDKYVAKIEIFKKLIAETIFCLKEIIRLSKTIGETYLFNYVFMGSIHEKLSYWIRLYESWEDQCEKKYEEDKEEYEKKHKKEYKFSLRISEYLQEYLGKEWREQLSGYYEMQRALSHYYKCLETHKEGRAYHNMVDDICYLKDDYNDRSDHFNIAEERHNIMNGKISRTINRLRDLYKDSRLYKVNNYFGLESEIQNGTEPT
jgi:hypothetical protein